MEKLIARSSAPSNIALIKYMGKVDPTKNIPTNSSLSFTLNHLKTFVELEVTENLNSSWEPLSLANQDNLKLSASGQQRYISHLEYLKNQFQFKGQFIVRSNNNFPASCGLASSASSFAALTICTEKIIRQLKSGDLPSYSNEKLSHLSQHGSGSSCRSFFTPWALWEDEGAKPIDLPYSKLLHHAVVIEKTEKKISSSLAHKLVTESLLFERREKRASARLEDLIKALKSNQWREAYQLAWAEFWDMHSLFESAKTPFGYMTAQSLTVLDYVKEMWSEYQDGPIATMDAGPNVHLLFREDQKRLYKKTLKRFPN